MLDQPGQADTPALTLDEASLLVFHPDGDHLRMHDAYQAVRVFLLREVRCVPHYAFISDIEEDIVQETLLEAIQHGKPLTDEKTNALALLSRMLACNVCDARRRRSAGKRGHGMERVPLDIAEDRLTRSEPVDAGIGTVEWRDMLNEELLKFPRDTQLMIRLRLGQGLEYEAIAARRITWTADSVRKAVERALVRMRQQLEARGIHGDFLD